MTSSQDLTVDILIIGAGPTGLYAAFYAGFRGLAVGVLDALDQPGGQVAAMYPEKAILDIAGFPTVTGRGLVDGLLTQAAPYCPTYVLGEQATTIDRLPDGRLVIGTGSGRSITTGAVIVCGGIGAFTPRPLTAGLEFVGRGVSYFVPDPSEHSARDVVIVGGGDSAFDWALHLEPIARSVTLVHRRDKFRAHRASVDKVMASSVRVLVNTDVTAVRGGEWVDEVDLTRKGEGTHTLRAQSLIASLGFTADLGPLHEWGVEIKDRRIPVDSRMQTSLDRVYAAGDITDYVGKVRLIAVGFGEAATAVNNAAVVLDPTVDIFPGHSTEQDV